MPRIPSNISVPVLVLVATLAAAGASGCGGGSSASSTTTANGATVPKTVYGSFPAPVGTGNTTPSQPPREAPPSNSTPRSVYGSLPVPPVETHAGAGRGGSPAPAAPVASATFVVRGGRLTPARRTVPAMTPFALTLVSADGRRHLATLRARSGYALEAVPGRPGTVTVPGLARGSYALSSGRFRARLVVKRRG